MGHVIDGFGDPNLPLNTNKPIHTQIRNMGRNPICLALEIDASVCFPHILANDEQENQQ